VRSDRISILSPIFNNHSCFKSVSKPLHRQAFTRVFIHNSQTFDGLTVGTGIVHKIMAPYGITFVRYPGLWRSAGPKPCVASSLLAPASLLGSKALNNALCRSAGLLWPRTRESALIQTLDIALTTVSSLRFQGHDPPSICAARRSQLQALIGVEPHRLPNDKFFAPRINGRFAHAVAFGNLYNCALVSFSEGFEQSVHH
jgi:hypothetical protein